MRKKIVAGNWKMNNTLEEGKKLTSEVINIVADELTDDVQVILGTPAIHLDSVGKLLKDAPKVALSAQNCSEHAAGAYTGEISAKMLTSVGAEYVILGHSERREYFNESNEQLAKKVDIALENGLTPIFCCGEALEIREAGTQNEYVCQQLTESLFHLSEEDFKKIVIAYEPIWAIGTGKTASAAQAQEMHAAIRAHLTSKYGAAAEETSILYGGSCKPSNANEIFAGKDVDGGLIGGASLAARDFVEIAKSF
ncbi:MAG: triose-phosphate isomerase [Cytophagales bacterium]|nr:triose-phosphate isomerase [Cytophagales bacterium]